MIDKWFRNTCGTIVAGLISVFSISSVIAQDSSKELGIRYLKLGNTYREAGDYTNAQKYLSKGLNLAGGDRYWKAVTYEYMGYVYRDKAFTSNPTDRQSLEKARDYFAEAFDIYSDVITMKDGSPEALAGLKLEKKKIDDYLRGGSYNFAAAGVVNYDSQKLKSLPADFPENATSVSLRDNRLKDLPYQLIRNSSLTHLSLADNRIKSLSSSVGQLSSVQWLDLSGNRIKELPATMGLLNRLEVLDLSDNRLKEVPVGLCQLTGLKILNLSGNRIEFEQIKNLIQCLPNTNIMHDKYVKEEENDLFLADPSGNQGATGEGLFPVEGAVEGSGTRKP
ncbi:MAG: hypothetical protein Kapaf2KO_03570 [Candidatus Kapaibacteriales bacterium]